MTPESFLAWRNDVGLSQKAAAEQLGLGRRTVQDYEAGRYPVPRSVALACSAIFHRLEPWEYRGLRPG
jgi:DNA-binding XRE family transcriptional regulator